MIFRSTSRRDHDTMLRLAWFAVKSVKVDHVGVMVKVKNSSGSGCHGRAFPWSGNEKNSQAGARYLITVLLGNDDSHLPCKVAKMDLYTWQEEYLFVVAHEFEHIRQFQRREVVTEKWANVRGRQAVIEYRKLSAR